VGSVRRGSGGHRPRRDLPPSSGPLHATHTACQRGGRITPAKREPRSSLAGPARQPRHSSVPTHFQIQLRCHVSRHSQENASGLRQGPISCSLKIATSNTSHQVTPSHASPDATGNRSRRRRHARNRQTASAAGRCPGRRSLPPSLRPCSSDWSGRACAPSQCGLLLPTDLSSTHESRSSCPCSLSAAALQFPPSSRPNVFPGRTSTSRTSGHFPSGSSSPSSSDSSSEILVERTKQRLQHF
jgi:hypothetical protein